MACRQPSRLQKQPTSFRQNDESMAHLIPQYAAFLATLPSRAPSPAQIDAWPSPEMSRTAIPGSERPQHRPLPIGRAVSAATLGRPQPVSRAARPTISQGAVPKCQPVPPVNIKAVAHAAAKAAMQAINKQPPVAQRQPRPPPASAAASQSRLQQTAAAKKPPPKPPARPGPCTGAVSKTQPVPTAPARPPIKQPVRPTVSATRQPVRPTASATRQPVRSTASATRQPVRPTASATRQPSQYKILPMPSPIRQPDEVYGGNIREGPPLVAGDKRNCLPPSKAPHMADLQNFQPLSDWARPRFVAPPVFDRIDQPANEDGCYIRPDSSLFDMDVSAGPIEDDVFNARMMVLDDSGGSPVDIFAQQAQEDFAVRLKALQSAHRKEMAAEKKRKAQGDGIVFLVGSPPLCDTPEVIAEAESFTTNISKGSDRINAMLENEDPDPNYCSPSDHYHQYEYNDTRQSMAIRQQLEKVAEKQQQEEIIRQLHRIPRRDFATPLNPGVYAETRPFLRKRNFGQINLNRNILNEWDTQGIGSCS